MKVQLQGQSLRLRIGEEELARLLAGEDVLNATAPAPGVAFRQRLRLRPDALAIEEGREEPVAGFEADAGAWCFELPEAAVRDYVARLPCRDALEFGLQGGGTALKLAFEVDVRDSVRHRGPPARRKPRTD